MLFLLSLRFGQISPLAFFRWFFLLGIRLQDSSFLSEVAVKIPWRRPEVKFGRNVVKEETTQKTTKMRKKRLILRLRSLISKWFQLKDNYEKKMFVNNFACVSSEEQPPLDLKLIIFNKIKRGSCLLHKSKGEMVFDFPPFLCDTCTLVISKDFIPLPLKGILLKSDPEHMYCYFCFYFLWDY